MKFFYGNDGAKHKPKLESVFLWRWWSQTQKFAIFFFGDVTKENLAKKCFFHGDEWAKNNVATIYFYGDDVAKQD